MKLDPQHTWFISDIHFGHANIMKFCPLTRPFASVEDMEYEIIEKWNSQVEPGDEVYFLGDFAFAKAAVVEPILKQLNGNIHMVYGNHDQVIRKNPHLQKYFTTVQDYLELDYEKTKICLMHYPMQVWNKCHHGSIHLHGHSHGECASPNMKRFDVGYDVARKAFSLAEIMEMAEKEPSASHHKKDVTLTIVRGLPGAGKSTYVREDMAPQMKEAHFEADMYFETEGGDYVFNKDLLHFAHKWCLAATKEALEAEKNTVVSNTFVKEKEMKEYVRFAKTIGAKLRIINVVGDHESIHEVPTETIERMRENFLPIAFEFIEEEYTRNNSHSDYSEMDINTTQET